MTINLSRTELNILLWALAVARSPTTMDTENDISRLVVKLRELRDQTTGLVTR